MGRGGEKRVINCFQKIWYISTAIKDGLKFVIYRRGKIEFKADKFRKKKQISWKLISRVVIAIGKIIINGCAHRGILRLPPAELSTTVATREM